MDKLIYTRGTYSKEIQKVELDVNENVDVHDFKRVCKRLACALGYDSNSVEEYDNKKFAHFTNIHQATFILTKEQLLDIGKKYDFTRFFGPSQYSVKCKVNTDIYQYCGMKKLICISEFEDNLIHHLPNIYINGINGRSKLGHNHTHMLNSIKEIL